jgi:hypothetical protein
MKDNGLQIYDSSSEGTQESNFFENSCKGRLNLSLRVLHFFIHIRRTGSSFLAVERFGLCGMNSGVQYVNVLDENSGSTQEGSSRCRANRVKEVNVLSEPSFNIMKI